MGFHRRADGRSGGNLEFPQNCQLVTNNNATGARATIWDIRAGWWGDQKFSDTATGFGSTMSHSISPHPTRAQAAFWSGTNLLFQSHLSVGAANGWAYGARGAHFNGVADPTPGIGTGSATAWGPHGAYFAAAGGTTPFLAAYVFFDEASEMTAMTVGTTPAGAPAGSACVAWSPNGDYLALAHATTPFVTIYSYDPSSKTLTKLANPATLPANSGQSVAWSPNGDYLAVGNITTTPFLRIYDMTSGTPTSVALSAAPTFGIYNMMWSTDGVYLHCIHNTTQRYLVYRRDNATFTKISTTANPSNVQPSALDLHPNGKMSAYSWATTSPFIRSAFKADEDWLNGPTMTSPGAASLPLLVRAPMPTPSGLRRQRLLR